MLVLICGVSRAGKTTYSKRYKNVVHLDELAYALADRYATALRMADTDNDIVFDGIYNKAELRADLVGAYKGDSCVCVWLDTPLEVIKMRTQYKPVRFEPPTYAEGWSEIIRIK